MGSRFVQVTFRFRDQLTHGMDVASKKVNGVSNKLQAQYSKVSALGREWTRAGKSMTRVGDSLTRKVTLPIVAAATASGKLAMDFDKSMAQVNTLLDDDSHLEAYKDSVLKVSDELGIKATTASEGLYQTISVLGDHGETTSKTFAIMARSAKAGGAEVIDAVNMIATAMNGYGEVSDETAQRISDLSFKTVKLGKTTFPELANSMSPLFPLAHTLGLSYEELYATMSTATTSFAGNTAEASTQIKGLMTGFLKPSKAMVELMDELGYSSGAAMVSDLGLAGALEKVQSVAGKDDMAKYFGNIRGLTAALGLSGSGMEKYKKHLEEMKNATGATGDALAKVSSTDAEKWNKALVKVQNAGIKLGQAVLPAVTPLIEQFGGAISKAAKWFSSLDAGQQQMIVKMLAIAAATGPVLSILGRGATGIGSLLGTVSKFGQALDGGKTMLQSLSTVMPATGHLLQFLTGSFTKFSGALKAGGSLAVTAFKGIGAAISSGFGFLLGHPIVLVIAGIAAIAAGAFLIWKNWDKIKPHLKPVFDMFEKARAIFEKFKAAAVEKIGAAVQKFQELKEKAVALKGGVVSKFEAMKEKVGAFKEGVGNALKTAGSTILDFARKCQNSTTGIMGYYGGLMNFVKGVFAGDWKAAWRGIVQAFSSIFNGVRSTASSVLGAVLKFISPITSKIQGLMNRLGSLKSKASSVINNIPKNASGTNNFQGGLTYVHEKGGEIIDLPRHTRIIPHDVSVEATAKALQSSSGKTINIAKLADTLVVREEADIDKIAEAIAEKLEMLEGDMVYE